MVQIWWTLRIFYEMADRYPAHAFRYMFCRPLSFPSTDSCPHQFSISPLSYLFSIYYLTAPIPFIYLFLPSPSLPIVHHSDPAKPHQTQANMKSIPKYYIIQFLSALFPLGNGQINRAHFVFWYSICFVNNTGCFFL